MTLSWVPANTATYPYDSGAPNHAHAYLLPTVRAILAARWMAGARVFDLGCGNGSAANELALAGYDVTGVDPSEQGIEQARRHFSSCTFDVGSAYDDLASRYGQFDAVVSLEVVEHVAEPRRYAAAVARLLKPAGVAIVSTPYHSYLKNLTISLMGRWDSHMDPLWDHGHIKLWSRATLGALFREVQLHEHAFHRVGRLPVLAKSMILTFTHARG